MKKILRFIFVPFIFIGGLFTGVILRQPSVNKLKKQIIMLQKKNETFQQYMSEYHSRFDDIYVKYKSLKIMELKRKAEYEGKLKDNLVLQYGMKDYFEMLFNAVKDKNKLDEAEYDFYKSFDNVIEGKDLKENDFVVIKNFVMRKHKKEINELRKCDIEDEYKKLSDFNKKSHL